MEPRTLATDRLVLRTVGPQDTEAVHAACQDPDIQRWTTIPSPYLPEHARGFTERLVPDGWANESMFTFGLFLPSGELVGMLGVTMISPGVGEIGFWGVKEHRGHGYVTEAASAVARWAFTHRAIDRLEWRAEVGNTASRTVAERVGFTMEGTLRAAIINNATRRDCWIASLLPPDLTLPTTLPYLPSHPHPA
ncbi:GNAT family N-acetyltransferase [Streptomyces sp. SID5910]|uniref:GNAT family N-acetyltransferase n=1 Tax=Streptomyces sp. SID5910 TaxID=2690312 RepID=UPI001368B503|nr:GNAT family N-acetyltransferase [Streptomyces sp. SID5910]MYR42475.1 GNAT family N-acetyltransferase [Streptomyces sp. SID5910]